MHLESQVSKLEEQLDEACVRKRTLESIRTHKRRGTVPKP